MSSYNFKPIPLKDDHQELIDQIHTGAVPGWDPDGPTLRFPEMLKVVNVGRSSAYKLMQDDPTFPQGIPLFDSERSPRIWWTHEVIAWVKSREEKARSNQGGAAK